MITYRKRVLIVNQGSFSYVLIYNMEIILCDRYHLPSLRAYHIRIDIRSFCDSFIFLRMI